MRAASWMPRKPPPASMIRLQPGFLLRVEHIAAAGQEDDRVVRAELGGVGEDRGVVGGVGLEPLGGRARSGRSSRSPRYRRRRSATPRWPSRGRPAPVRSGRPAATAGTTLSTVGSGYGPGGGGGPAAEQGRGQCADRHGPPPVRFVGISTGDVVCAACGHPPLFGHRQQRLKLDLFSRFANRYDRNGTNFVLSVDKRRSPGYRVAVPGVS